MTTPTKYQIDAVVYNLSWHLMFLWPSNPRDRNALIEDVILAWEKIKNSPK